MNFYFRSSEFVMSELRNRGQNSDDEEHEALIDEEESGKMKVKNKSGIAGDEKNILVLLFLYILQVIN